MAWDTPRSVTEVGCTPAAFTIAAASIAAASIAAVYIAVVYIAAVYIGAVCIAAACTAAEAADGTFTRASRCQFGEKPFGTRCTICARVWLCTHGRHNSHAKLDVDGGKVKMRKVMFFGAAVASSAVQAQVGLDTYQDANGYIDIQNLTCAQLANTFQEAANALTMWYSGWYNGLGKKHFLNFLRNPSISSSCIVRNIPISPSLRRSVRLSMSKRRRSSNVTFGFH
jgi:hypothetical protein